MSAKPHIRAEPEVTQGVYSSRRSGSAPDSARQHSTECLVLFWLTAAKVSYCVLNILRLQCVVFVCECKWHVFVGSSRLRRMRESVTSRSPSSPSTPLRRRSRRGKRKKKRPVRRTTPRWNRQRVKVKSFTCAEKRSALSSQHWTVRIQTRNTPVCSWLMTAHRARSWLMITAHQVSMSTPIPMTQILWMLMWIHKVSFVCRQLWAAMGPGEGLTSAGWAWTAGKMPCCFQTALITQYVGSPALLLFLYVYSSYLHPSVHAYIQRFVSPSDHYDHVQVRSGSEGGPDSQRVQLLGVCFLVGVPQYQSGRRQHTGRREARMQRGRGSCRGRWISARGSFICKFYRVRAKADLYTKVHTRVQCQHWFMSCNKFLELLRVPGPIQYNVPQQYYTSLDMLWLKMHNKDFFFQLILIITCFS